MTAQDLYDFETNVANAIIPAFSNVELVAITVSVPPDFQKPRPRSELVFKPGAAASPQRIMNVTGRGRVIAAYSGELEINSITDASGAGKFTMSAYRAMIREIMELDQLRNAVNLASSPYWIDFISPTGGSEIVKSEDGNEMCRLTYSLQFSIKQDAFNQLAAAA